MTEGISTQKHLKAVDLTKFIACIFIVFGHIEPLITNEPEAYFLIHIVFGRFAVPFFFMTAGYLYYRKYSLNQNRSKILSEYGFKYLKRLLSLYFIWSLVYFPYVLHQLLSQDTSTIKLFLHCLRIVLYSGAGLHMWYFPALILSIIIIDIWISRFKLQSLLILSAVLCVVGLLGDSYSGLIPPGSFLSNAFELYFSVFLTTRNGLFYGLLFVVLGAYFNEKPIKLAVNKSLQFTVISLCLLGVEALLLHRFSEPNDHNFMIMSLPLSLFLFHSLININLSWNLNYILLRKLSTLIYCAHIAFIIFFTTVFRNLGIEALVGNGLILFTLVLLLSMLFSIWVVKLENHKLIGFIAQKLV